MCGLAGSALTGCSSPAAPSSSATTSTSTGATASPTPVVVADPAAEARALYTKRCATCHGREGLGDGPASGMLNPRPRSFADAGWQTSVTDAAIEKIILEGGVAVGKSPLMPPNPDLADQKAVVAELRALVRKLGRRPQ